MQQMVRQKRGEVDRLSSVHKLLKRKHDMLNKTRTIGSTRSGTGATSAASSSKAATSAAHATLPPHMRTLQELMSLLSTKQEQ